METLCEVCGEVASYCESCYLGNGAFGFLFGIFAVFLLKVFVDVLDWVWDRVAVVYRGAVARKEYYELKLVQEKASQSVLEKEAP